MLDPILIRINGHVGRQNLIGFKISGDSNFWYQGGFYVPNIDGLHERILAEAYESC